MYKHLPSLTKGMNTLVPPDSIEDGESPYIENLVFDEGIVKVDAGYRAWGSTVLGYPQKVFQLFKKAGTSVLLLITTSTLYEWASSEWQFVSDSNESTVSGSHGTGSTTIVIASTASFSVDDVNSNSAYVGIILGDGTQHQTKVSGVSAPHWITLNTAFGNSDTCADGAAIVEAVPLEGDLDDPISCAVWVADDDLIFTNHQDNVKLYDSSADECKSVAGLVSSGDCQAKIVRVFNNYVVLYGTIEGGVAYPQRVRRCDTGDPTDWSTGNAGYDDLWEDEDEIQAVEPLGPYEIIYKEGSIVRQAYVGTTAKLFAFETLVPGKGAAGVDSVAVLEDCHYALSLGGIYKHSGGYSVTEMGAKMRPYLFGKGGVLNPGYAKRAVSLSVDEMKEVWFMIPEGSDTELGLLAKYNRDTDGWTLRPLTSDMCGYGRYESTADKTWNDLVGSWAEQDWAWNETRMLSGSPEVMLCCYNPLQVYEYDYVTVGDAGKDLNWEFQTKDLYNPHMLNRMNLIEFFAKGSSVVVSYSTDRGSTWTVLETVTLATAWARYRVWHQLVERQIRYKFSGSGGGLALEWLGLDYEEESSW